MKIFDRNLTNKELRSLIIETATNFGVKKVCFNRKGKDLRGSYNCHTGRLYLDLKQTKKELLVAFFHELGHHTAVENHRWLDYHFQSLSAMTAEKIFRVENRIDRIACKLWNKYVDRKIWGRYKYVYPKTQRRLFEKSLSLYFK